MLSPKEFVHALTEKGFHQFTGVPCSFFQAAINYVIHDPKLRYTIVPNEGSALALASGAILGGTPCAVFIQNSGFGNLVNPLTSLNMIYKIPVLIFMSGRAYGVKDEPQHEIIGKTMGPILDAMGVKHEDMPQEAEAFEDSLERAHEWMLREKLPFVYFVRKDTIDEFTPERPASSPYPLKRLAAIETVMGCIKNNESVIVTTGKPSRELFASADRPKNFYMQGSMGHAASIGLGLAMNRPNETVLVLDGDGAVLMHMGILSSIGHYKPKNLIHVVLDNEAYESTGNQDTTSKSTDFVKIALASGYVNAFETASEKEIKEKLGSFLKTPGPSLLRIKINREDSPSLPRISSKYSSKDIAKNFSESLSNKK